MKTEFSESTSCVNGVMDEVCKMLKEFEAEFQIGISCRYENYHSSHTIQAKFFIAPITVSFYWSHTLSNSLDKAKLVVSFWRGNAVEERVYPEPCLNQRIVYHPIAFNGKQAYWQRLDNNMDTIVTDKLLENIYSSLHRFV